jgi:hypothetical protein
MSQPIGSAASRWAGRPSVGSALIPEVSRDREVALPSCLGMAGQATKSKGEGRDKRIRIKTTA